MLVVICLILYMKNFDAIMCMNFIVLYLYKSVHKFLMLMHVGCVH